MEQHTPDHAADTLVLMYHRVAEPGLDPWNLCVSPDNFRAQLERLATNYLPVSGLQQDSATSGAKQRILITFDDGYVDNLINARPLLEKFSCPALFFITTGYMGGDRQYWWDELQSLILTPGLLPQTFRYDNADRPFEFELGDKARYTREEDARLTDWKVTYDGREPPSRRHKLFLELWHYLWLSSEGERRRVLEFIREWAAYEPPVQSQSRPMTETELVRLANSPLVEIGSHTVTHSPLPGLSAPEKRQELAESRNTLEQVLGKPVDALAYPHGEYDADTLALADTLGYSSAYGTKPPKFGDLPGSFQIPRKMVQNWNAPEFDRELARFLN
jgi:peptidoglycan/xylan/chitin deacetylase (PgdA/CDA1 family)